MRTPGDPEIVYPLTTNERDYIYARLVADGVCAVRGFRSAYPLVTVYANRWDGKGDVPLTYSLRDMPEPESHIHIHVHTDATSDAPKIEEIATAVHKEFLKRQRMGVSLGFH